MVELLHTIPLPLLVVLVFLARVADVSLGTVRTLSLVRGMTRVAMLVGFCEVLIWITVISQVITRVQEHPALLLAYAAGFAAGNGVGMLLERKLALGIAVLQIVSASAGERIADALRRAGQGALTTIRGEGAGGPVTMIYAPCARRQSARLVELALSIDPELVYVVENAQEWNRTFSTPVASPGKLELRSLLARR